MAKKVRALLTLQIPAGQANPAPPVGTALGPHGINIMDFCKAYNERTSSKAGQIIPAQITSLADRPLSFVLLAVVGLRRWHVAYELAAALDGTKFFRNF